MIGVTTAATTDDLVAVSDGLNGQGVFASLATDYPASVQEALWLQDEGEGRDPFRLPVERMRVSQRGAEPPLLPIHRPREAVHVVEDRMTAAARDWIAQSVGGHLIAPAVMEAQLRTLPDIQAEGGDAPDNMQWWRFLVLVSSCCSLVFRCFPHPHASSSPPTHLPPSHIHLLCPPCVAAWRVYIPHTAT